MPSRENKAALLDYLRTAILTMTLAPGADLDETRLSRDFALSRTPLREVFRQLAGEGYVALVANRGARVAEMSYGTLRDFFLAAPMIYGAILRLAAVNATPAQITDLEVAQAAFVRALQNGDTSSRSLANNRFHEVTGEMAANIYLLPSFRRLLIDHARISMTFYDPSGDVRVRDAASRQHDEIIAAIRARDEAAAGRLANEHWMLSRGQIEKFVMPQALDVPMGAEPKRVTG